MKNLKKLLCGALSLTMVLGLAACGGNTATTDSTDGDTAAKADGKVTSSKNKAVLTEVKYDAGTGSFDSKGTLATAAAQDYFRQRYPQPRS